jgi:CBS domain-containing protein
MGTKVREVMTARPRVATPETPLSQVAELMDAEDVGAVPIVEGDQLAGMVTDRDIVIRAVRRARTPAACPSERSRRARSSASRRTTILRRRCG